jgi:hypothetical protein
MARFNFPSRLPSGGPVDISTFPLNLVTDNRSFYTEMSLARYRPPSTTTVGGIISDVGSFFGNIFGAAGDIVEDVLNSERPTWDASGRTTDTSVMRLPIPKKVNENQVLGWQEVSVTDIITNLVAGTSRRRAGMIAAVKGLGSAMTGAQVNPYLYLYFDRPTFKRFNFTWTLTARNEDESRTIRDMVLRLKKGSSPSVESFIMLYPDVLNIRFYPDDIFGMIRIKPCIIESVSVDYTPSGPSFFESGAPTLVNITLSLKEIQLWEKEDPYYDSSFEDEFTRNPSGA